MSRSKRLKGSLTRPHGCPATSSVAGYLHKPSWSSRSSSFSWLRLYSRITDSSPPTVETMHTSAGSPAVRILDRPPCERRFADGTRDSAGGARASPGKSQRLVHDVLATRCDCLGDRHCGKQQQQATCSGRGHCRYPGHVAMSDPCAELSRAVEDAADGHGDERNAPL